MAISAVHRHGFMLSTATVNAYQKQKHLYELFDKACVGHMHQFPVVSPESRQ